jgi:hypothetical protein
MLLEKHLKAAPICSNKPPGADEGMTDYQKSLLRKSKRGPTGLSEEEKWREVYCILFPDIDADRMPSPCEAQALLK